MQELYFYLDQNTFGIASILNLIYLGFFWEQPWPWPPTSVLPQFRIPLVPMSLFEPCKDKPRTENLILHLWNIYQNF